MAYYLNHGMAVELFGALVHTRQIAVLVIRERSGEPIEVPRLYRLTPRRGGEPVAEGYSSHNVLASYVHLHFGSNPDVARNLVAQCQRYKDLLREGVRAPR